MKYLFELSVIHLTLVMGYWLILRGEKQYGKMRFYLLMVTTLALIIPMIKLPLPSYNSQGLISVMLWKDVPINAMTTASNSSVGTYNLILYIYAIVTSFFAIQFIGNVVYLIYLETKSRYEKFNDLFIRKVRNIKGSFTFFNWIFLSDEIDKDQADYDIILKHEKAHAKLGHTYDVLYLELFRVFFWWLPSAWFVNKEIRKIHEYQADAYALKSCNVDQYSSILISSTLKANGLSLASSFHDGLILKRIKAMKQKAKIMSPWKYGAIIILCAIISVVFACNEEPLVNKEDATPKTEDIQGDSNWIVEMPGDKISKFDETPRFPGGVEEFYKYIASELKYPQEAITMGVEGRVFIEFVVEKDGSISNVRPIKGIGAGCDKEAVRVIENSPAFEPGKIDGKPIRANLTIPIVFALK